MREQLRANNSIMGYISCYRLVRKSMGRHQNNLGAVTFKLIMCTCVHYWADRSHWSVYVNIWLGNLFTPEKQTGKCVHLVKLYLSLIHI